MLVIHEGAADAIREIVRDHELPEGGGVRIAANVTQTGSPSLTVSTARSPHEDDHVVAHEDALVFVEPAAAVFLEDKLLGVETDAAGRTTFVVHDR